MTERKLDLLVVLGVVAVIVVGGFLTAPLPPLFYQVLEEYAAKHWEDIGKALAEGRVCAGMTLQTVWELRGTPQSAETDLFLRAVTYTWDDPPLRVTLTMETFPWLVLEVEEGTHDTSGRMPNASLKSLTRES